MHWWRLVAACFASVTRNFTDLGGVGKALESLSFWQKVEAFLKKDPENQTWFWGSTIFKKNFKNPQVEMAKVQKPPAFCTRMNGSCYSFPRQESNEIPMWMMIYIYYSIQTARKLGERERPTTKQFWTAAWSRSLNIMHNSWTTKKTPNTTHHGNHHLRPVLLILPQKVGGFHGRVSTLRWCFDIGSVMPRRWGCWHRWRTWRWQKRDREARTPTCGGVSHGQISCGLHGCKSFV